MHDKKTDTEVKNKYKELTDNAEEEMPDFENDDERGEE